MTVIRNRRPDGGVQVLASVCRAEPFTAGGPVNTSNLRIDQQLPHRLERNQLSDASLGAFYAAQARSILDALNNALPGGTLDALFAAQCADRASLLSVRHRFDRDELAAPVIDDVVDAVIHDADCIGESPCCVRQLRAQVAAVVRAHAPCHTDQPWSCTWGHADPATGLPDAPAVCTACTYDDRTVLHPCPTAAALGVCVPFATSTQESRT